MESNSTQWAGGNRSFSTENHRPQILLFIENEANREQMTDWLAERYDVVSAESQDDPFQGSYDLCIVDEAALQQNRQTLEFVAQLDDQIFQPFLLLTTEQELKIGDEIWKLIDEVITIPTKKSTVARRIENLLDRRLLSRELAGDLEQAKTLFQKVFEYSNDAICIIDWDRNHLIDCNQKATELLGYQRGELLSLSIADIHPTDFESFLGHAERVAEQGHGTNDTLRCHTKDGTEIPVEISSSYIELGGRPHLINNIRDISERKEREHRRRQSERYRERLYEITSNPSLGFNQQIDRVLTLGCERLGVENGHLVRINRSKGHHEVVAASGSETVEAGAAFDLADTYCRRTIAEESILAIHDAKSQGWEDHPAYEFHNLEYYLGAKIIVDENLFGTVCFVDREAKESPITEHQKTFIELIAQWLGHEFERTAHQEILRNLHDVSVELLSATSDREIANIATRAVEQVFGFDIAGVRLLDDSESELYLVSLTDEAQNLLENDPPPYTVGEGIIGETFQQNDPRIISDLQSETTPFEYGSIRSAMCFPLNSDGTLTIGSTEVAAFDQIDIDQFEILATNVAAALTRIKREQSLREAHRYRSKLFENATDSIVDVDFNDGDPIIRDVNASFENVFGYDAEDVLGEKLQELIVPTSSVPESGEFVEQALGGEHPEAEVRRETATGLRDFLLRVVPVAQEGEVTGGYAVYTDITHRKRREQQVQVLNRILRHNLRNKVNIMHGQATRIVEDTDSEATDAVQAIVDAASDLMELTEKTGPLRRMINNENAVEPGMKGGQSRPVDLREFLDELRGTLEETHPGADISVRSRVSAQIPQSEYLKVALEELVDNAIKHADRPDSSVSVIVTESDENEAWIEFCVSDNGPGIPVDEIEVLQDEMETPLSHTSGLGLWMVNWLVRGTGGELSFDVNSTGSTARVALPIQRGESPAQNHVLFQIGDGGHD